MVEIEAFFSQRPQGHRHDVIRVWEVLHDIPPGRDVVVRDSRILFSTLL